MAQIIVQLPDEIKTIPQILGWLSENNIPLTLTETDKKVMDRTKPVCIGASIDIDFIEQQKEFIYLKSYMDTMTKLHNQIRKGILPEITNEGIMYG